MSPWVSLLLEACMAALMAALIVYCVKLNRRLALLREQGAEIRELVTGLRDASERADLSVQRLKAAGLAAERSLRGAIEDASTMRASLAGLSSDAAARPAPARPADKPIAAAPRPGAMAPAAGPAREKRDMLMGAAQPAGGQAPATVRPRTREEAEDSVIQAIRSARGEA